MEGGAFVLPLVPRLSEHLRRGRMIDLGLGFVMAHSLKQTNGGHAVDIQGFGSPRPGFSRS